MFLNSPIQQSIGYENTTSKLRSPESWNVINHKHSSRDDVVDNDHNDDGDRREGLGTRDDHHSKEEEVREETDESSTIQRDDGECVSKGKRGM